MRWVQDAAKSAVVMCGLQIRRPVGEVQIAIAALAVVRFDLSTKERLS